MAQSMRTSTRVFIILVLFLRNQFTDVIFANEHGR
jgi:hypothetical protein